MKRGKTCIIRKDIVVCLHDSLLFFILQSKHTSFYPCPLKKESMKNSGVVCILLVSLCFAMIAAGCTSSKGPAAIVTSQSSGPAAVTTTPACPDKLVWDGEWDSRYLGMAGNHDLSTAWTKYKDSAYGELVLVKMTQTCWDVEGTFVDKGIKCDATFTGKVEKNTLLGTWSSATMCGTKSESGRKFSLTMAADNKSWLGDFYSDGQDPSKYPPNWAGRRPVK